MGCRRCPLKRKATLCPSVTRDGRGPCGVEDPVHARKHHAREPGEPRFLLAPGRRVESAAGSPRTHAADARAWAVRQPHSAEEGPEQSSATSGGGAGGKAAGQAEPATRHHAPDTEPGAMARAWRVVGDVRRVRQAAEQKPGRVPSPREARARCGSSARRDLWRGRPAMAVPTPIEAPQARSAAPKPIHYPARDRDVQLSPRPGLRRV
jgi:hypothetical protein